jgi:hypothetical protein
MEVMAADLQHVKLGMRGSKLIRLDGSVMGKPAVFLMDGGATHHFISRNFVLEHAIPTETTDWELDCEMADGSTSRQKMQFCRLPVTINDYKFKATMFVIPMKSQDVIVGKPWFDNVEPDICWKENTLRFDHKGREVVLARTNPHLAGTIALLESACLDLRSWRREFRQLNSWEQHRAFTVVMRSQYEPLKAQVTQADASAEDISDEDFRSSLDSLCNEFKNIFEEPTGVHSRGVYHHIPLVEGAVPPTPKTYRLSFRESEELRKQLDGLLSKGWIRPSCSPYGAPVLFAFKKNGGLRMCIDYRALNNDTIKDNYGLPLAEDCLNQLGRGKFKSRIDLYAGYHQIEVWPADIPKTAMRTKYGSFEWVVMPFGLTSAPATFQRLMNTVLQDFLDRCVVVYLDDILIYSKSRKQHLQDVRKVFEALEKAGLFVQASKCEFGITECEFLGHIVTADGVKVDPDKIAVIKDWPVPSGSLEDIKDEVRSFLGLANYYRKFVGAFARITTPLTNLLSKNPEPWSDKHTQAFNMLKQRLTSAPVLVYPNPDKPFYLFFDSSTKVALGGVLCQADENEDMHPVAFESRKLTLAEKNYPVHELETLAFVHCVKKWRHFLDAQRFFVFTDNSSVGRILTNQNPSPRLVRWVDWLQRYQFTIKHIPRSLNQVADTLSNCKHARLPDLDDFQSFEVNEILLENAAQLYANRENKEIRNKIISGYMEDTRFAGIYESLQEAAAAGTEEEDEWYVTDDGRYTIDKNMLYLIDVERLRLCVPKLNEVRREIIRINHDIPLAGHLGLDKTYEKITRHYYWNRMFDDVSAYIRSCDSCQKVKAVNEKPSGLLVPTEIPEGRWLSVSMDFIVGLPETPRGHNAISVFVDRFTKRPIFAASRVTDTARDVAILFIKEVVSKHGVPLSIISDRDPKFTSEFWQEFTKLIGIDLKMSTAMHPQTDGQTERMNRTLEEMLRHYVDYNQRNWDELLPMVEFAYADSVQTSTGMTPFYADLGRHPNRIQLLQGQQWVHMDVKQLKESLTAIQQRVHDSLIEAQYRQKHYADQKRRDVEFEIGDKVLLDRSRINLDAFRQVKSQKLLAKYMGPYKILERIGKVAYRLELPPGSNAHPVFHVSALRSYTDPGPDRAFARPEPVQVGSEDEYHVEEILDERVRRKRKEYLVRWRGYPLEESTWEPVENLEGNIEFETWRKSHSSGGECNTDNKQPK